MDYNTTPRKMACNVVGVRDHLLTEHGSNDLWYVLIIIYKNIHTHVMGHNHHSPMPPHTLLIEFYINLHLTPNCSEKRRVAKSEKH